MMIMNKQLMSCISFPSFSVHNLDCLVIKVFSCLFREIIVLRQLIILVSLGCPCIVCNGLFLRVLEGIRIIATL